jgi:hypothetical protein
MNRPAAPNTDPSTVWLANLIDAMEAIRSSPAPCERSISEALRDRLHLPARLQPQGTLH